jgi:hypothetical protein
MRLKVTAPFSGSPSPASSDRLGRPVGWGLQEHDPEVTRQQLVRRREAQPARSRQVYEGDAPPGLEIPEAPAPGLDVPLGEPGAP